MLHSVQIVPYWNWNTGNVLYQSRVQSSNCTLLELKPKSTRILNLTCRFKLYLTGIETCTPIFVNVLHQGSNCTLLELKLIYEFLSISATLFKLYLTGIETRQEQWRHRQQEGVQIVPYWNWNRFSRILLHWCTCSNCTLLELKHLW